jgi:Tol biopolymer transport system component
MRCRICLGLLLAVFYFRGLPAPSAVTAVQVLKGDSSATHISADGKYVLFIDWSNSELFVRELKTQTDRQLTHRKPGDPGQAPGNPVISHDGQTVAYDWYTSRGSEIRLIPFSGGEPRTIGKAGPIYEVQGWTQDDRELLLIRADGREGIGDLGFLNVESGQFRNVARARASAQARLSPDGSQIVVAELSREDPTQRDIRLIDGKTGASRMLLSGKTDDYSPDWAPDGRSIFFLSDRGKPRLWKLRLAAGVDDPEPLDDMVDGALTILGVTRQGSVLVGAGDIGGTDSYVGVVDWDSGRVGEVRMLRNPPYKGSRRAALSPDGKQVAFLRRSRGYLVRPGWQIPVVQSFDGKQERVYPTALTLRDEPAWYPDGRALLFGMPPAGGVGESGNRIWSFVRLDLSTGEYSEVGHTGEPGLVRMGGLTDRSLFYLLSDFVGPDRVMQLDWKTGASTEIFRLTEKNASIGDVSVLGNRERIALAIVRRGRPSTIEVLTPPSADLLKIGEVEANSRPQIVWCSDGKSILVSGRVAGAQGVWRLSVSSGSRQRLSLEDTDITEVRLSEDDRHIAYTRRYQRLQEAWVYQY